MREREGSADEAAAFWFARLRSDQVSRGDRDRFLRWLNRDPAHSAAYADYEALWGLVGRQATAKGMLELRQEALAMAPVRSHGAWRNFAAIAASLLILLFGGWFLVARNAATDENGTSQVYAETPARRVLRTEVGQRSAVTLDDGSVVELNTNSEVVVDYSEHRRDIRLLRGQALFEVAPDAGRPFVVEAAGQRITALGTAFDVRVDSAGMRVTLIEGRVSVSPVDAKGHVDQIAPRTLTPGEQLVARADQPVMVLPADVQQAVSWRTGRLVFSDEPLGQVIEEFNRYSARKLVLADPSLRELRVSGVFRSGSTASLVTALETAFPIEAENRATEVVLSWE